MPSLKKLLLNNRGRGRLNVATTEGEATIYLYDMIVSNDVDASWFGGVSAESFVKELAALDVKRINLRINSPGGSVFAARAMEQALRQHNAEVHVYVDGLAASAASFVAMAGSRVEMAPGSFFMIHKAWSWIGGNADDMLHEAELLEKIDGTIVDSYAKRTGMDKGRLSEMLAAETWLTSDEALEMGFADAITEDKPKNTANWDLSAFANAPELPKEETQPEPQADRTALRRDAMRALIPA